MPTNKEKLQQAIALLAELPGEWMVSGLDQAAVLLVAEMVAISNATEESITLEKMELPKSPDILF